MTKPAAVRKHHFRTILVFVLLVALLVPSRTNTNVVEHLVNTWLLYSLLCVGFYFIFGVAGRFAFCQTLMMAVGAYTTAWVTEHHSFLAGAVVAIAITTAFATAFAVLMRRAQAFYFAIATLALTEIGLLVIRRWEGFGGNGGTRVNIPFAEAFGREFVTQEEVFWLLLGALTIALLIGALVERSPLRREAIAGRDLEVVAETSGIPVRTWQVVLFAFGSAYAGAAGALYAHWQGTINVDSFGISLGIGVFLIVMLGGIGSMWGAVIGSAFYVWMPQIFSGLDEYTDVVYGALLVVVMIFFPQGLIGLFESIRSMAHRTARPFLERRRAARSPVEVT